MPLANLSPTPHLILGGARSGKSEYAETLISSFPPPYVYIATSQILDGEMRDRVQKHRDRRGNEWRTIESPMDLLGPLTDLQGANQAVLVDCLTLWLTNLILASPKVPATSVDKLCDFVSLADYPLIIVSNEVGSGIVPENSLARRFRDLAGVANQRLAAVCRAVTLVVAGLQLPLKPSPIIPGGLVSP